MNFGANGEVEIWWDLEAVCKTPGFSGPGQERALYVRASALK